jgi:hypothetical protein
MESLDRAVTTIGAQVTVDLALEHHHFTVVDLDQVA